MVDENLIWDEKPRKWKEDLEILKEIVDSKTGIVRALIEYGRRSDEPKFFSYTGWMCNTEPFSDVNVQRYSAATALERDWAMIETLGEAVERYCLSIFRIKNFLYSSYSEIEERALDPKRMVSFSKKQLSQDSFKIFQFNEKTKFRWVEGYSLTQHKSIYVPAQLVYVPYLYENEIIIRFPNSAGGSPGGSLAWAICHGICELVERDAFLITYLNKLEREQIAIESIRNEELAKMSTLLRKYGLEVYVYDITSDIPIPSILAILIDRSDSGVAVVIGTSTGLDPISAVIGSVKEAQQVRPGLRDTLLGIPNLDNLIKQIERDHNLIGGASLAGGGAYRNLSRFLYWSRFERISEMNFLLKNRKRKEITSISDLSSTDPRKNLKTVLKMFQERNMEVIFVDVTTPDIRELGYKVVRVIIPELQPLYLDERYKYLGNERLYRIPKILGYRDSETREEELNTIPHPFT